MQARTRQVTLVTAVAIIFAVAFAATANAQAVGTWKLNLAKILSTMNLVVSPDGKMLTITTTGKDGKGQNADSVAVYDKQ